jgi:hypothetical protein
MSKLRLDPEALQVESFDTRNEAVAEEGTVFANGRTVSCAVYYTCPECYSPYTECASECTRCPTQDLAACAVPETQDGCNIDTAFPC